MRQAEAAIMDWQSRWDAYARDSGESARAAEVERTRLNFLDKQSLDASSRLNQLEDERRKMDVASLSDGAETLLLRQEETKEKVEQLTLLLDERNTRRTVQEQTRELQHQLNDARSRLQSAKGRMASLEALQHAALGQEKRDGSVVRQRRARVVTSPRRSAGRAGRLGACCRNRAVRLARSGHR